MRLRDLQMRYYPKGSNSTPYLLAVLIVLVALSIYMALPVRYRYHALDTGPWGHSGLAIRASIVLSLKDLDTAKARHTLLIIARGSPPSPDDAEAIKRFAEAGATIIVYGEPEAVTSILNALGIEARYEANIIDPVFSKGSAAIANTSLVNTSIALESPYLVRIDSSRVSNVEVVSWTSNFSYIDLNSNGFYDVGEDIGSYPVGYRIRLGEGEIIVFSSRGVLTNSVLEMNSELLNALARNRSIVLDQSWTRSNLFLYTKLLMGMPTFPNPILTSLTVVAIVVLGVIILGSTEKR